MFRLYLGASGLQIYSAPAGAQGTDLSHDLIVRIFTWLEKNENPSVVSWGGEDGRLHKTNVCLWDKHGSCWDVCGGLAVAQGSAAPSRVCHSSLRDEGQVKLNMGPVAVRLSPW